MCFPTGCGSEWGPALLWGHSLSPRAGGAQPGHVPAPHSHGGRDKAFLRLGCSIRDDPPRAARCCCEEWAGAAGSCCGPGQGSALSLAAAPLSQGLCGSTGPPCPNSPRQISPCGSLCSHIFSLLPSLPPLSSVPIPISIAPGWGLALPHHTALPAGTHGPHGAWARQAGRAGSNGQQEGHSLPHMCCPPCHRLCEAKLVLAGHIPPSSLPLS